MTRGDVTIREARAGAPRAAARQADAEPAPTVERLADGFRVVDGPPTAGRRRRHAARTRASRPTCSRWCSRSTPSPRARRWSPRTSSRRGSCSSTSWCGSAPTSAPTATTPSCAAASGCPRRPSQATDIRAGAGLVVAALCADGDHDGRATPSTSTAATRASSRTSAASAPTYAVSTSTCRGGLDRRWVGVGAGGRLGWIPVGGDVVGVAGGCGPGEVAVAVVGEGPAGGEVFEVVVVDAEVAQVA